MGRDLHLVGSLPSSALIAAPGERGGESRGLMRSEERPAARCGAGSEISAVQLGSVSFINSRQDLKISVRYAHCPSLGLVQAVRYCHPALLSYQYICPSPATVSTLCPASGGAGSHQFMVDRQGAPHCPSLPAPVRLLIRGQQTTAIARTES